MEMTLRHMSPTIKTKTSADVLPENGSHTLVLHQNVRSAFCATHHCEPGEFIPLVFRLTLHRRALPFYRILQSLKKDYFQSDLNFLNEVGNVTNNSELVRAIKNYQVDCHRGPNYLHDHLRMRVSCRRLMKLCEKVLGLTADI
jgi:hypothetical protein